MNKSKGIWKFMELLCSVLEPLSFYTANVSSMLVELDMDSFTWEQLHFYWCLLSAALFKLCEIFFLKKVLLKKSTERY